MNIGIIVLGIILLFYWLVTYNSFVVRRNKAKHAFASIDVQLKKRWDLIPQLVANVKNYAKHEKEIFVDVVEARTAAQYSESAAERIKNERVIDFSLGKVMSLTEGYPELYASQKFEFLVRNLSEVEAQISAARRSYNTVVTSYNTSLEVMPSSVIARLHGFQVMDLFSVDSQERSNVDIAI